MWWETRSMGQPRKGLLTIVIIGILVAGNLSFLTRMTSADTSMDTGLALYYPFDDNHYNSSGYNVKDWSGNDNDGIIYNHSYFTGNTLFGRAMAFDGVDDYVFINHSSSLLLGADLTIEVWIFRQGSQYQAIVQNPGYFGLYILEDGSVGIGDGLGIDISWPTVIVEPYKWTHLSYTREMLTENYAEMKIYLDGQLAGETQDSVSFTFYNSKPTYIGCHGDDQNNDRDKYFYGIIDELRIYDEVKTPADGMGRRVLNLPFEEYNGNIVYDRSGMNVQGTVVGASWDSDGVYGGRCLDFNGISDYAAINPINDPFDSFYCEMWICWEGSNAEHTLNTIIQLADDFPLWINDDGHVSCPNYEVLYPIPIYTYFIGDTIIPQNKWTKISITGHHSDYHSLYVNGLFEGEFKWDIDVHPTNIGCYNNQYFFNGKIDNIQIYDSPTNIGCEILRYSTMNGNMQTVYDESPFSNNGSLMDEAYRTSFNPLSDGNLAMGYDNCLELNSTVGGDTPHVYIPQPNSTTTNILDELDEYSIEARIWWEPKIVNNGIQTIVFNHRDYWLYLYGNDTDKSLCFKNAGTPQPTILVSSSLIHAHTWTYVAATVARDPSDNQQWIGKLYINGILDIIGPVDSPNLGNDQSGTYIGCEHGGELPTDNFNGYIDDIIISNYEKSFREDTDGDSMPDVYEIIRSVDSKEYNYLEYNGRYALLCAPVRSNKDNQFKYDITQMRYYLVANGWSDCDIIFLTCSNNDGRTSTLDQNIAVAYNGPWIDGEAYRDNLGNALEALRNGGLFSLLQSNDTNITQSIARPSTRDTLFIELRDHGYRNNSAPPTCYFDTYTISNYNTDLTISNELYWSVSQIDAELDNISAKYIAVLIDMCNSGGWINPNYNGSIVGNNRIILTSQYDEDSSTWAYLFYSRIRGEIFGSFLDINGNTPLQNESVYENNSIYSYTGYNDQTANADGVVNITISYDYHDYMHVEPVWGSDLERNCVISLKEAYYFARCACNDRFRYNVSSSLPAQDPQISTGGDIYSPSIYI